MKTMGLLRVRTCPITTSPGTYIEIRVEITGRVDRYAPTEGCNGDGWARGNRTDHTICPKCKGAGCKSPLGNIRSVEVLLDGQSLWVAPDALLEPGASGGIFPIGDILKASR